MLHALVTVAAVVPTKIVNGIGPADDEAAAANAILATTITRTCVDWPTVIVPPGRLTRTVPNNVDTVPTVWVGASHTNCPVAAVWVVVNTPDKLAMMVCVGASQTSCAVNDVCVVTVVPPTEADTDTDTDTEIVLPTQTGKPLMPLKPDAVVVMVMPATAATTARPVCVAVNWVPELAVVNDRNAAVTTCVPKIVTTVRTVTIVETVPRVPTLANV